MIWEAPGRIRRTLAERSGGIMWGQNKGGISLGGILVATESSFGIKLEMSLEGSRETAVKIGLSQWLGRDICVTP